MISKSFLKRSFLYTLAGTLPLGSVFILLPFYIHYLSAADFGALSIYLAFSLLVQILVTFGFDSLIYLSFHEHKTDPAKLSLFISSSFIMMKLIGAGILLLLIVTGPFTFDLAFRDSPISFYPYGLISVITGISQSLYKVHNNLLQTQERAADYFWSNLILFTLIVVFTVTGFHYFPDSLMAPLGGRMVASVLMGGWSVVHIWKAYGLRFDFSLLRPMLSFNTPMWIYNLQMWVINYFDRYIILMYLDTHDLGVYDFALKCLVVIEIVMSGLYGTIYPKVVQAIVAQAEKKSTVEINRYYHAFLSAMMLLIGVSILTFPIAIDLLIPNTDYRESIRYIPYIAITFIFRTLRLYFASPFGIIKYTKPLPVIYTIVSAVKIALMVWLIAEFKIYGIIAASVIALVIEIVLLIVSIRDKFVFKYNVFKMVVAPVSLFVIVLIFEPLVGVSYPLVVHTAYVVCSGVLLLWLYRHEIRLIDPFKLIKNK